MPKYMNPDLMDLGLDRVRAQIAGGATVSLRLVTEFAQGDAYAAVNSASILSIELATGDLTLANQGTLGRELQVATKSGTASGSSQQYTNSTATAGGASTLTDSGQSWTTNEHAGRAVTITGGTGSGQTRRIASNTGTVLTVDSAWSTQPSTDSTYVIRDDLHFVIVDETNSEVLAATDETTNQVVTSGNSVTTPALAFQKNQPT